MNVWRNDVLAFPLCATQCQQTMFLPVTLFQLSLIVRAIARFSSLITTTTATKTIHPVLLFSTMSDTHYTDSRMSYTYLVDTFPAYICIIVAIVLLSRCRDLVQSFCSHAALLSAVLVRIFNGLSSMDPSFFKYCLIGITTKGKKLNIPYTNLFHYLARLIYVAAVSSTLPLKCATFFDTHIDRIIGFAEALVFCIDLVLLLLSVAFVILFIALMNPLASFTALFRLIYVLFVVFEYRQ